MHALNPPGLYDQGLCWTRAFDLTWALTANFAIWALIINLASMLRAAG
jgi:hypothetical protein